jgi:hypothetical protein
MRKMARSDDDDDYKVGYAKPPRQHQFPQGVSGNPAGRPRGARNKVLKRSLNPFLDVFLRETDRVIPLREAGQTIQLSVFEASVRKLGVKALNGDHRALTFIIEGRRLAEQARIEDMATQIQVVERYKAEWKPQFELAKQRGLPEPKQLPHPDHVQIDPETGVLVITGPDSPELKEYWDTVKQVLRSIYEQLIELRAAARAAPRSKRKAEAVRQHERMLRNIERKRVPPGWNWREEIGDYLPKWSPTFRRATKAA